MAQKPRTVHPGDARDERLARLPLSAAYTYAYLPTVLDDEGRAHEQPAVFNGYLWPLRAEEHPVAQMEQDVTALVEAELLCRYTADGQTYVHDPRWKTRQKVSRPLPSALPRCPRHEKTFEEMLSDTLGKVSEQVNVAFGAAATNLDEARVRDWVARMVEDVTYLVDPEKAASYGEKVHRFFARNAPDAAPTSPAAPDGESGAPGTAPTDRPPTQPPPTA